MDHMPETVPPLDSSNKPIKKVIKKLI
jgi:hypothetical protein